MASDLGIPAKSLRALEWDRRDLLGAFGEVDRIERRYAAYLGLEVEPPAAVAAAPTPPEKRRRLWLPLLVALAPAVVVLVYVAGELRDDGSARRPQPQPRVAAVHSAPEATGTAGQPAARGARPVSLVLTADRGASWVEAHSGSITGAVLFRGTVEHGREVRVAARRIWLRLGAASNLSVAVDGRPRPAEYFGTVDLIVTSRGIRRAP